jgi:hypothetical protein
MMTQPYETDFGLGPDDEDFRPEDDVAKEKKAEAKPASPLANRQ